jgi:signal transduction histidine kinase
MPRGEVSPGKDALPQRPRPADIGRRIGPRAAMISGFGALLLLMVILSFDSVRLLHDLEASSARVRQDFLNRERTLEDVRSSLYETGNILRDYALVQPDSNARESFDHQLRSMRDHTNATLNSCMQSLSADQRLPFQNLSDELNNYWSMVDRVLNSDAREQGRSPLHSSALAQHAAVLAITRDVSTLNERELRDAELKITDVFVQFRERIRTGTAVAFFLGLLLAACTIVYVARLEQSAEEKYQESLRSHRELKELSKRLVDAQEEERRAISRELHDQVGQSLSALLMDVQSLTDIPQDGGAFPNGLRKIKLLAENCVNEVRNMALLLRPSMLDDLGLIAALEWQGREVSKRTGLLVEIFDEHFADNLPEEHKTCVYRVVQEALQNCTSHAHARKVRVIVQENSNHLVLTIEDDGIGFDPRRQRGMGLLGMQERVTRLGGSFEVESSPGHGTRIRVDLPLTAASAPHESVPS